MDPYSPLMPVVAAWLSAVKAGAEYKQTRFGVEAREGLRFFSGPYDFFFESIRNDRRFRVPNQRQQDGMIVVSVNKVAEMVQIFGPSLYFQDPRRQATPRTPPDIAPTAYIQMAQGDPQKAMTIQQAAVAAGARMELDNARAALYQAYGNFSPAALDLKTTNRMAIDEAIITGLGVTWTETITIPGTGRKLAGNVWDSVDNLILDPEARTIDTPKWVARYCRHPAWQVEDEYGLPRGSLKGTDQSFSQAAAEYGLDASGQARQRGEERDLVGYWKIWSKMGIGGRLPRIACDTELRQKCEAFGNYAYLVVCDGCPFPLNLPPWETTPDADWAKAVRLVQWPTPFWADGGWPFTPFYFHTIPNDPWPQSHLSPAMGEMKALNWLFAKIVNKIKVTSRDLILISDDVPEELKELLVTGEDLEVLNVRLDNGKTLGEMVQFLQHPQWNNDIWHVLEAIESSFEKRTGLSELLYGESSRQLRSAAEARVKQSSVSVRPDDMANKVEDAASLQARRELFCAYWHLTPADIEPVLGPLGAVAWASLVYSSPPEEAVFNMEFRVEASSAKKPNKDALQANMQTAMQNLFQPLYQYASATGNTGPVNALLKDWGDANDMRNIDRYLLPAPPPQPAPAGGPPGQAKPQSELPPQYLK